MDKNTFQVIITDKISARQNKELVIEELAKVFKIKKQQAEKLISKPATIIKKNIDEATAKKFMASVLITGADCKIVNIAREAHTLEATEHLELDDIDEINSGSINNKTLCPNCGSIKYFNSDECLTCGPNVGAAGGKSNILKYISISIVLLAVLAAVGYQFVLPFYNSHSSDRKIENGLQLAFDTRNKVSEFILRTNFIPNQNLDAGLEKNISNEIIESIIITDNSVMTITLRAKPLDSDTSKTIIFKPRFDKGKLIWNCTKGSLENKFRPGNCKKAQ